MTGEASRPDDRAPHDEPAGTPDSTAADSPGFSLEGRTLKQSTPGLSCELCGGPVLDRHCKVVCLNCGFIRDCSDP